MTMPLLGRDKADMRDSSPADRAVIVDQGSKSLPGRLGRKPQKVGRPNSKRAKPMIRLSSDDLRFAGESTFVRVDLSPLRAIDQKLINHRTLFNVIAALEI